MALTAGTSLFGAHVFYISMTATLEMKKRKKSVFLSANTMNGTTWIASKTHFTKYTVVNKVTKMKGMKSFISHMCYSKWYFLSSFTAESPTCPGLNAPREKQ